MINISSEAFIEAFEIVKETFLLGLWETLYVTFISTFFAVVIGTPLGVLLVTGEKNSILPLPGWILRMIDVVINILRSIPFLIMMVVVMPLTRALVGTSVGTIASIVPLVVAAFPYIARLVESSLREVDPNLIEMAQSSGASPFQIITKVLLPESVPSLINNLTIAITTIIGYTATSGALGGGGLGKIAMTYGYYRYKYIVMILAVILLVVLVQGFQTVGTALAKKSDKRLKNN